MSGLSAFQIEVAHMFFSLPAEVREQFLKEVKVRGWQCQVLQSDAFFVRLHVKGTDEVLVDIAIDVAAQYPSQFSILGPTFNHEELAGRKLLALFDQAEARDFADVIVLAQMMRCIVRFSDGELPIDESLVEDLRSFFEEWANELDPLPARGT